MLTTENTKHNAKSHQALVLPTRNEQVEELVMWARALLIYCGPNLMMRRSTPGQDYNAVPEAMVVRETILVMIGLCNKMLFELGKSADKNPNAEDLKNYFARLASQLRTLREMMGGLSLQDTFSLQSFSSVARAIRREFLECPVLNAELVINPTAELAPAAARVLPGIQGSLIGSIMVGSSGMLFYSL